LRVLIFEDNYFSNLYPLSILRSIFDIKCGIFSLKERIENVFRKNYEISLHCRNQFTSYLSEIYPDHSVNRLYEDDYLFLNSRVVFQGKSLRKLVNKVKNNTLVANGDIVIAAKISKDKIDSVRNKIENKTTDNTLSHEDFLSLNLKNLGIEEIIASKSDNKGVSILNYPWDTIKIFDDILREELDYLFRKRKNGKKRFKGVSFIDEKRIQISKGVKIYPGVVLDAQDGEIFVDKAVTIEPFSFIKGPVYVGTNSAIKSGTKLYGPCSIGKYSRVSGEISHSLFHAYVNKQHDGFFGNSYVGEFVNIGADTVTSNLKNNYSKIKVKYKGNNIDTGLQFLGSIFGDHSKIGINTMINTGSIFGVFSNIAGGGFQHKEVKSFSWNILGRAEKRYNIEQAIDTAKVVMGRRGINMSSNLEKLIRIIHKEFDL
jgi:UDP-N-acetylglucosamine diphosphorylase/glucosamine-1-phosphate N-acetyltransferase